MARPKPRARRASAWPIRPIPTMPMRLPSRRAPSIAVGLQPVHLPARTTRSPSPIRRAVARTNAIDMSAVSSVSTPGVLVTVMPRWRAVSRSIWSTPVPNEAMSLRRGPACDSTRLSMRSVTVGTSTSAAFMASTSSAELSGLSTAFSRVSNSSISRVSIASGSFRVTITSGFFFELDGMCDRARLARRGMSPITNYPSGLSSNGLRSLTSRKSALFQVLVDQHEDLRYKDGDGNPTVPLALGHLCHFDGSLPAGAVLCRGQRACRRQVGGYPAQGVRVAHSALRLAPIGRGQCPHRPRRALPRRLGVQTQGHAGRNRRRIRELAQNPRLAGSQRQGSPEPVDRQAQLHYPVKSGQPA